MINLSELKPKKDIKPPRIVLYAEGGFGKSTFASEAPNPIFMDIEQGAGNLNVTRVPTATYNSIEDIIISLRDQDHDFKTLVVDSIDWLERLIIENTCQEYGVKAIEDIGYGKGWESVVKKFNRVLSGFDALQRKGMVIIILAHRAVKKHDTPTGESYDIWTPKLHGTTTKGDSNIGLLTEWCDILLFGEHGVVTKQVDKGFGNKVEKAVAHSDKIVHTEAGPAFMAKSRYELPSTIPFTKGSAWANFYNELKKGMK
jgi:hypothetical protein